jgi:hypothetical protein
MNRHLTFFAAAASILAGVSPALADSIDGHWCNSTGTREMAISGPHMMMGGKQIEGSYSRHSFAYTAPDKDPKAGAPVSMLLVNENTIRATTGSEPTPEIWRRCEQTS